MSDNPTIIGILCSRGEVESLAYPNPAPESIQAAFNEVMDRLRREGPVVPKRLMDEVENPDSPIHNFVIMVAERTQ